MSRMEFPSDIYEKKMDSGQEADEESEVVQDPSPRA